MTDNEIIKAFRECGLKMNINYCDECPYNKGMCNDIQMAKDILDLINRLQAENENLKAEVEKQKKKVEARNKVLQDKIAEIERLNTLITQTNEHRGAVIHTITHINEIKAEAYKEFAERLKNRLIKGGLYPAFVKCRINELLKELVGE